MACRLLDAKLLPEAVRTYYHLNSYEQISIHFQSKYKTFLYKESV